MEILNKVLYWISTGLMLPVVVILLFLFLRSLAAIGSFYGTYMNRLRASKILDTFLGDVSESGLKEKESPKGKAPIFAYLERLFNATQSPVNREKTLADFELAMARQLASTKSMSKLGPVLGLMGTLIPMGPALIGLASGNIASMAENMQVAFSTTVVGLIVGAIGFILTEVKQRWFAKDLSQLHYIADLITEENEKKKK
ncbi:MotA/TolQ/ExbB proton channel family protein [Fulvivirgaceae bacterium BMA10]|uniref:MotA/TolQ/ExbB proton channel family protein n=1 Tax=Splendidivirga corallicola TaxID=3051826 RepID=A0ABT8KRC4_9BACT|nr:MotA/TolQ/ExbB proton channel family protein [Fulvivirgaceae bacterium BMA10]